VTWHVSLRHCHRRVVIKSTIRCHSSMHVYGCYNSSAISLKNYSQFQSQPDQRIQNWWFLIKFLQKWHNYVAKNSSLHGITRCRTSCEYKRMHGNISTKKNIILFSLENTDIDCVHCAYSHSGRVQFATFKACTNYPLELLRHFRDICNEILKICP